MKILLPLVLIGTVLGLVPSTAIAETPPVEHYAHLPMVAQPSISPDGKHVAVLVANGDGYNVAVSQFGKSDLVTVVELKEGEARIDWIEWANNERLLVSASYVELIAGRRFKIGRLYAVNYDGSDLVEIKQRASKDDSLSRFRDNANVLSYLEEDPKHIILQGYNDRENYPVAYKVNIYENAFEKL
ncbi:MAG: hypothetical protein VYD08_05325, partial [Pseudomonadota bacterium]|nr:hypothetical protein [Pseudomonadota bacterium]